jgi:hypothetical protein
MPRPVRPWFLIAVWASLISPKNEGRMMTEHMHHSAVSIRNLDLTIDTTPLGIASGIGETPMMWPFVNLNSMPPFSLLVITEIWGFCAENRNFVESKKPPCPVDQFSQPMTLEQLKASVA